MNFSFDTIKDFDRHIELSVPNYTHIHELIKSMSTYFIKDKTRIYDIGCSTGKLLSELYNSTHNKFDDLVFIGYDNSENMQKMARDNDIYINISDLNKPEESPIENASLVLSIFTLQFLSISDRWKLIKRIYDGLNPGGAFIVCEKTYLNEGFMQNLFNSAYYDFKRLSFSAEEILNKEKDLRKIMQPQTEGQNRIMFRDAGFNCIETFFSSLMFKGWVMVK